MNYEYHVKCDNPACRDYRFLFAVVAPADAPVICRVCASEAVVVAVHPAKVK